MLRRHYLIKEKIKKINQEPTKIINQSENGMSREATRANGNIKRSSGKKHIVLLFRSSCQVMTKRLAKHSIT